MLLPGGATLSHTVQQADTTTELTASPEPSVSGQAVTYVALVTVPGSVVPPGGTVAFGSRLTGTLPGCGSRPLGVVGPNAAQATCTITYPSAGSDIIRATYSGDPLRLRSEGEEIEHLVQRAPTAVAVTSTPAPSVTGQSVTYTAAVGVPAPGAGTPSGTVSFTEGGEPIGGCTTVPLGTGSSASCTVAHPRAETHAVVATYHGDDDFLAGSSAERFHPVQRARTSTSLTVAPDPALPGDEVTLRATVVVEGPGAGDPSGFVVFLEGETVLGSALLDPNGRASVTLGGRGPGDHDLVARYLGDADFVASSGDARWQVRLGETTTGLTSTPNPSVAGGTVTYTATVARVEPGVRQPSGVVRFTEHGEAIAGCEAVPVVAVGDALQAACVVRHAAAGTHDVVAEYLSDGVFAASASPALRQVVGRAPTTTTLTASPSPVNALVPVTLSATVAPVAPGEGAPAGTVTFYDYGIPVGEVPVDGNGSATLVLPGGLMGGTHLLTAAYSGDADFEASDAPPVLHAVDAAPTRLTPERPAFNGLSATLRANLRRTDTGAPVVVEPVRFMVGSTQVCVATTAANGTATCAGKTNSLALLLAGGFTVAYAGSANLRPTNASGPAL